MAGVKSIDHLRRENSFSNLNVFKEAKSEINKFYTRLSEFVVESNDFLQTLGSYGNMFKALLAEEEFERVNQYIDKVSCIQGVISRNSMKCAFFGRTSNGKSTTINAMLGEKILPAGLGHTTSCFLEIQGAEENQGYLIVTYPNEDNNNSRETEIPKPIDSVSELASDLSSKKVEGNALIKIYWPTKKCSLLSEDVVFIDSPGIDVELDIDKWIDLCCSDADVFVYVANGESTINISEKRFFHKVKAKLSKPNIFILNNRWDASANEEPSIAEQARKQHMEKYISFLTKELKVCSKTEAESRVFFVSAKEALINRNRNVNGHKDDSLLAGVLKEGWQNRYFEFTNFEKNLETVLSESATKTKFASHTSQGQEIILNIKTIMENLFEHSQEQKNCAQVLTTNIHKEIERLNQGQKDAHQLSIKEINRLSEKFAERVAQVLREELRRLDLIIDEYSDMTFSEEPRQLAKYKLELNRHVQEQLSSNLNQLCAPELTQQVTSVTYSITKRYVALLKEAEGIDRIKKLMFVDYSPEFLVDCRNYHSGFQEDLSFRFSFGPSALFHYMFNSSTEINRASVAMAATGLFGSLRQKLFNSGSGKLLLCGGVIGSFVLVRSVSWKLLSGCAGIYSLLYGYEYWSWKSRPKERLFKSQFSKYLVEKIRLTMDNTSRHSALQPQFALKTTLKNANNEIDNQLNKLKEDMHQFEEDITKLESIVTSSRTLKNKAIFLENNVKEFEEKFID